MELEYLTSALREYKADLSDQDRGVEGDTRVEVHDGTGNLYSSEIKADLLGSREQQPHLLLLDIDKPAFLVPSTKQNHFHLYISHELTWEEYEEFLLACKKIGLVGPGFVDRMIARKAVFLRKPGVKKAVVESDS